jgi:hypothetical protein
MKLLVVLALVFTASAQDVKIKKFTAAGATLIANSWDAVKDNEVDILYAVFKAYPDIQAKFPSFVGKDLDAVKESPEFARQSKRIITFLTDLFAIGSGPEIGYPAGLTLINEMGQRHKSRGITKAEFNNFRTALVAYVSTHAEWDEDIAAAWKQGLDSMFSVVFSNLKDKPVTDVPV